VQPTELSVIIFFCIFSGAMIGMALRAVLPEHHLNTETRELVKLGVGLIGTMAALLLGLLVASAKSSYDARGSEVNQMAANVILLDRALAHYGPGAGELRGMLKTAMVQLIDQIWSKEGDKPFLPQGTGNILYDKIAELTPQTDAQRELKAQAQSILVNFGQTRLLLYAQSGTSISTPFLVVVVFWLATLFVSFGLFAPHNGTAVVTLLVAAISVAGALFLILELDHPFSGLIQISSAPLQNAVSLLAK
jgi:hypothetical protein